MSPVERFSKAADVLRPSPSSQVIREAFRLQTTRVQRRSDGTISLAGVRFEIPARLRHFREVVVRYARWDLRRVDVIDPHRGTILSPIYPLDRTANADGCRRIVEPGRGDDDEPDAGASAASTPDDGGPDKPLPPLLKKILDQYSASGTPPAYLPKKPRPKKGNES
jgi:hypothetical protein